jgi:hypothetical protein
VTGDKKQDKPQNRGIKKQSKHMRIFVAAQLPYYVTVLRRLKNLFNK